MKQILLVVILFPALCFIQPKFASAQCQLSEKLYSTLTAQQCADLIESNSDNPNFVILDVRTPGEYNPQHIDGAINLNLYDSKFNEKLSKLNKTKTYLVHCKSGGRSANAFNQMKGLNFREVYNMQGGINSWNELGLPTTSEFAPRLGIYECSFAASDTVQVNTSDTIRVRISNSANDILSIKKVSATGGEYFTYFFADPILLKGAEDYFLQLIYYSAQAISNTVELTIETNAGAKTLKISRTASEISTSDLLPAETRIYPNPVKTKLFIDINQVSKNIYFQVVALNGNILTQGKLQKNRIDVSTLHNGIYILKMTDGNKILIRKFIKSNN